MLINCSCFYAPLSHTLCFNLLSLVWYAEGCYFSEFDAIWTYLYTLDRKGSFSKLYFDASQNSDKTNLNEVGKRVNFKVKIQFVSWYSVGRRYENIKHSFNITKQLKIMSCGEFRLFIQTIFQLVGRYDAWKMYFHYRPNAHAFIFEEIIIFQVDRPHFIKLYVINT